MTAKEDNKQIQVSRLRENSDKIQDLCQNVERIILGHGSRGMSATRSAVRSGYCLRAAQLLVKSRGTILIGTGFPVGGSFETDGPIGSISLYAVLEHLGHRPVFVCAPPLSRILGKRYSIYEIPILNWQASRPVVAKALKRLHPSLIVSVERPGVSADGRYYNIRCQDITDYAAKYDLFFEMSTCPTIAFGDGGNEIGMGNIIHRLSNLPIIPSVTPCDELVIATVSNWGVYGVIALMGVLVKMKLLNMFDPLEIAAYLVANGSLDGITRRAEASEDGLPMSVGLSVIAELQHAIAGFTPV